jgi:phosphatidylglycerol:prolipoprotein diacylglycerol transferase
MGFKIGSFEFRYYAIMILLGFICSFIVSYIKVKKIKKVSPEILFNIAIIALITSILGARIWSVMFDGGESIKNIGNFFGFDDNGKFTGLAGLSVQGGVLLATLCSVAYALWALGRPKNFKKLESGPVLRVSLWVYADCVIPSILIGQVVGRWGNFFNYELYGNVATNLNWLKVLMPEVWKHMHISSPGVWDASLNPENLRHPMFLYESFFNFIGFVTIYVGLEFIKKLRSGTYGAMYFIWYGTLRAIQEPFKHPPGEPTYAMVPYIVWSVIFVIFGVAWFVWCQFFNKETFRNTKVLYKIRIKFLFWFNVKILEKISNSIKIKNSLKNKDYYYRAFMPVFTKKEMYYANR